MKPKQVWIIDEGSQGHVVQSRGLARELAKVVPLQHREISARMALRTKFGRSLAKRLLHRWRGKWLFHHTHSHSEIPPGVPDLIISSGPHSLAALEYFSKSYRCPGVFVQGTVDVPKNTVDVIMRPFEGTRRDEFIFIPLLFNEITPEVVHQGKLDYLNNSHREKPAELKALFIGESSSKIRFQESDWDQLANFINSSWNSDRVQWLITTSYRTGRLLENHLRERIEKDAVYDSVWYSSSPRKITREFLGMADSVYVTMDSMTMVSEAVSSGLPVYALCPGNLSFDPSNTHHRYISQLERDGFVRLLRPSCGIPPRFTGKPVDYGPAVHQLITKLGWGI